MEMKCFSAIILGSWFCVLSTFAATKGWLDTYEAGLAQAKEEKKDLLISFLGSDWSANCQELQKEVLSKKVFIEKASEQFVLVELELPLGKPELSMRNEPIRAQYGIKHPPVLLLTDSEGLPYGEVRRNAQWSVANYLKRLTVLDGNKVIREEAREEFKNANDDAARTAALEKLLRAVPASTIPEMYAAEVAALRKSSGDKSEFVAKVAKEDRTKKILNQVQALMAQRRFDEVLKVCDEYIGRDETDESEMQVGLAFKTVALMQSGRFEEAAKMAERTQQILPKSSWAKQAGMMKKRAEAAVLAASQKAPSADASKEVAAQSPKVGEQKGVSKGLAKTDGVAPLIQGGAAANHGKSLEALVDVHLRLAEAEKAFKQAESELELARQAHAQAHEQEVKARSGLPQEQAVEKEAPAVEDEVVRVPSLGNAKMSEEKAESSPQLEERVEELRQRLERSHKEKK